MADQHENKSANSLTSTPFPFPTSAFVSSHTPEERPSLEIAECRQRVSYRPRCSQVSPGPSENLIPTEVRRPDQLQTSNSVEQVRTDSKPPTFLVTTSVASGASEDPSPLVSSQAALHKVRDLSQQSTIHISELILTATNSRHASVTASEIHSSVSWRRCMIYLSKKRKQRANCYVVVYTSRHRCLASGSVSSFSSEQDRMHPLPHSST